MSGKKEKTRFSSDIIGAKLKTSFLVVFRDTAPENPGPIVGQNLSDSEWFVLQSCVSRGISLQRFFSEHRRVKRGIVRYECRVLQPEKMFASPFVRFSSNFVTPNWITKWNQNLPETRQKSLIGRAGANTSKWNLLLWMGASTLDASSMKGIARKFACSRPM